MRRLGPAERHALRVALDVRGTDPLPERLDWPVLIEVARRAWLLPALAQRALLGGAIVADPVAREALRRGLEENAALNSRLVRELARVAAVLRVAGVDAVALKGAVLIAQHYPHRAIRQAADIDLLVAPERIEAAVRVLAGAGYVAAPHTRRLAPNGRTEAATLPPGTHGSVPLEGPSGAHLDLHHRVPVSGFTASGGFRGWLARAQIESVEGVPVAMCHPHDLAQHLCERFAWQEFANPAEIPRLLCDLRALFGEAPPWPSLDTGPPRARVAVRLARQLYEAAYGTADATDAWTRVLCRLAIGDPSVSPIFAQISNLRGQFSRVTFDLAHRPGYALRTWVPTRAYLAQRYRLDPASPKIYPLYVRRLVVAALKPLWPRR